MASQRSQRSLLVAPHDLDQLKGLVQAHRTPQAVARRAQLIQVSHTHPDWGTKQMARALNRHESWVAPRGDVAGTRRARCKMLPDQGHPVGFPLRLGPK